MSSYQNIGAGGADTWATSVASLAELPPTGTPGEVRLAQDSGILYYWSGVAWVATTGGGGANNVDELDTIVNGATPALGKITQVLSTGQPTASVANVGATGIFGFAVSVDITAGRWVVTGLAGFEQNTANLTGPIEATISNTTTASGVTTDRIVKDDSVTGGATVSRTLVVPEQAIYLNATTTYYLNTKFVYNAGSPLHYGRITARRIG